MAAFVRLLIGMLLFGMVASADPLWRFSFAPGEVTPGLISVAPDAVFSRDRGYGFEPNSARLFSAVLPEGDYLVTVVLGGDTTVRAESRRLMLSPTMPGATQRFVVNVHSRTLPAPPLNAPGGSEVRLYPREMGMYDWDDKLTLEFGGSAPKSLQIEAVSVLRVFLLGDSTVTDQPEPPYASWGQMLPVFFGPTIAVANYAERGETLKSFLAELRLDKVLSQMRPGDWAFIQFGHNDEKSQWPQTYAAAETTYRAYLRAYIAEIRRLGAHPVLVTPVERRNFDTAGHIVPSHGAYPDAVRAIAAEEGVPLIDLNAMSIAFYEALGSQRTPLAFAPGDMTHHNAYGAYELARAVTQAIKDDLPALSAHLKPGLAPFDPHRPDRPEDTSP